MDFIRVCTKESRKKGGPPEVFADYIVGRSRDLMVQGGAFYAVWDENKGLWSRDEYDVALLVDEKIRERVAEFEADGVECSPKYLTTFDNGRWEKFKKFIRSVSDNSHPLDTKVFFADAKVKRSDYASRKLPYSMAAGDISAYNELISLLYTPEERAKFEWAVGAIIAGDAKKIQKFLVFFGDPGTGKSTVLDIIAKLFGEKIKEGGYVAYFDAQALTSNTSPFSTAAFKDNPLVAIQHDGDLSKIETNVRLNSIVSHEEISINEKFKTQYDNKINAMLFMGTNNNVMITNAKSGLIRRLIDVNPTGSTFEPNHYYKLISQIEFQLGAIAHHCLTVYKTMGKNAYSEYEPENMMFRTDVFRNFVDEHYDIFKYQEATTLKQAWELYKEYCKQAELPFKMTMIKFREELKNYFGDFQDRSTVDGVVVRKVYRQFTGKQFKEPIAVPETDDTVFSLVLEETESLFDEMYKGIPAQYANDEGNPLLYWDDSERLIGGKIKRPRKNQISTTVLGDLDTSKLHFVQVPQHHIIIDFDLTDENGEKSLELNKKAASTWPPTYAEISKSGKGIHLHYIYDGDTDDLANEFSPGIEVKVYRGNGSLRRLFTFCNAVAVAIISSGIPRREKKPMLSQDSLRTEAGLRKMILRNLNKGVHPGTKPSIDFIEHLLKEAHRNGVVYDVSDMRQPVMRFAADSTNQSAACLKAVARMNFKSELTEDQVDRKFEEITAREERVVFFDCEVYVNLFVVCWKYLGSDTVVRMINPTPAEIEKFLASFKLVGFNNRGYDNHILHARVLGYPNEELYKLSQRIIVDNDQTAWFGGAWNHSYADVYDFSSDKKGLKKWEIELGIPHVEMDIPWDEPVPEDKILQVVEYCCNDVNALEAVWNACAQDFVARQVLADLSGLTVNHSTRVHAIKIMFGNEREPQKDFVYTDLSEAFPGYVFDPYNKTDKSTYQGETVGEGGYVYAEPGMYEDVAVLDIASMHPTSIIKLDLFGKYTPQFVRLVDARLAIKHGDFAKAGELLPGVEVDEDSAEALSTALKLVINSIYGYTAAKFPNPFRDTRNIDNIVAKRGALFMVDLKLALQERGVRVVHIKTDSVKIANATPEDITYVQEFGDLWGYEFEHEATYKKMCLVNDAVLVAYVGWNAKNKPEHWKAVGKEFQHPFVFKTLFTDDPINFRDLCETKMVKKGAMYLKFDGVEKEVSEFEDGALSIDPEYGGGTHIGRSGSFVAINPNQDIFQGGELVCRRDDLKKDYAVPGTKDYLWAEAEMVRVIQDNAIDRMVFERLGEAVEGTGSIADIIDMAYYYQLAEDAAQSIAEYGDFEWFADKAIKWADES